MTRAAGDPRGGTDRRPARSGPGPGASRAVLGFVARFAAAWVIALVAVAFIPGIERWAVRATVASLSLVLRALSIHAIVEGVDIQLARGSLDIVPDCTPLMPTIALWAALLAFPSSARWKAAGALVGAAALWIYDLVRVLAMMAVIAWRPTWFDFVHVYLWQSVTVIVVFGLFLLWLKLEPRPRAPA